MIKWRLFTLVCCALLPLSLWADGNRYATQSLLAKNKWVKVRVAEDGIYRLSYADLKKMGFSDPSKVSVHGYGGWMLQEVFSPTMTYYDDLPATAVWRGNDYLLFYGRGAVRRHHTTKTISHENNPYSTHGYYFITDGTAPKEMIQRPIIQGASLQITTFDDYMVHEKEQVALKVSGQASSGRELFGENFEINLSQQFPFKIPGITQEEGLATLRFVAKTPVGTSSNVSLSIGGDTLINGSIKTNSHRYNYLKAVDLLKSGKWDGPKEENTSVTIQYSTHGHKNVHLDYITLQMKRQLRPYGPYTFFRSFSSRNNVSRFNIDQATSGMIVFDVTDPVDPQLMETTLNGSTLSFTTPAADQLREFVVVDPTQTLPVPEFVGEVHHQNLHALPQTDMVILVPPAFAQEAERLAKVHREINGLHVTVVNPEAIYNEFSSGTPDATAIRRFMKMFYDRRDPATDNGPKYLLLFGDGSSDNRFLTPEWKRISPENFILTYQSQNSLNEDSYVTDDYFGLLEEKSESDITVNRLSLAIGRFPVRTVTEAKAAVNKVIGYMENKNFGSWKNQICFLADDGNTVDKFKLFHMANADRHAKEVERVAPEFLINKLYFDAFKKSTKGGVEAYPDIQTSLQKQLKEGLLILNYVGHGNATSLSDEKVINQEEVKRYNFKTLPLWVTSACDFAPFDEVSTSAGEDVFLNERSGGIGLVTTTRLAYAESNLKFNQLFLDKLFTKTATVGEALQYAKNNSVGINKTIFVLIGDPALRLNFPKYQMKVTEVNGDALTDEPIPFKALSRITLKGVISNGDDHSISDFNGVVSATIMDCEQTITTLDNNQKDTSFIYKDYPNTLYKGNGTVEGGVFSLTFTVPKDISYSDLRGKISLYAYDEQHSYEAQGHFENFIVGGTATDAEKDNEGPQITAIYLNDSSFVEGSPVNRTPFFVAKVRDKSGINIGGSSVGHDIMLTIDNNPAMSYNLNAYYESLKGGNEGIVGFSIPSLPLGRHTAVFKVWDVLNNSSIDTLTFVTVDGHGPQTVEVQAAPSPAREEVTFSLYHDLPESMLQVTLRVYDLTGRLHWEHRSRGISYLNSPYSIPWNLTDGRGLRVRPGIYIYQATIKTARSMEVSKANKFIVLGQ